MTDSSIFRGYLYETSQTQGCPMYHPCMVSRKCQNYDNNNIVCINCESRVYPQNKKFLGGTKHSGLNEMEDIQKALHIINKITGVTFRNNPFGLPVTKPVIGLDLNKNHNDYLKAKKAFEDFISRDNVTVENEFKCNQY